MEVPFEKGTKKQKKKTPKNSQGRRAVVSERESRQHVILPEMWENIRRWRRERKS